MYYSIDPWKSVGQQCSCSPAMHGPADIGSHPHLYKSASVASATASNSQVTSPRETQHVTSTISEHGRTSFNSEIGPRKIRSSHLTYY